MKMDNWSFVKLQLLALAVLVFGAGLLVGGYLL